MLAWEAETEGGILRAIHYTNNYQHVISFGLENGVM
jgi:hypothetical protein